MGTALMKVRYSAMLVAATYSVDTTADFVGNVFQDSPTRMESAVDVPRTALESGNS